MPVVNPLKQSLVVNPLKPRSKSDLPLVRGDYEFWSRPQGTRGNGPAGPVNPAIPASGPSYNFWVRPEERDQFVHVAPGVGMTAVVNRGGSFANPTNATYEGVNGWCATCATNGCSFLSMTPEEYQQYVDQPFMTAHLSLAPGATATPTDIRDVCAKNCPFMGDSFEGSVDDLSKYGDCVAGGACAWMSPNFNGACGVLPVASWSDGNAFVSADACGAAFGTAPIPISEQAPYPKCSNVPANYCRHHPGSKFCQSGSDGCYTSCVFDDMTACNSACSF